MGPQEAGRKFINLDGVAGRACCQHAQIALVYPPQSPPLITPLMPLVQIPPAAACLQSRARVLGRILVWRASMASTKNMFGVPIGLPARLQLAVSLELVTAALHPKP